MKKCFLLLLMLFVLTGCSLVDPQPTFTEPSATSSFSEATDATVQTHIPAFLWLPQPYSGLALSYEEYLSEVRDTYVSPGWSWKGADGKTEYFLDAYVGGFCVESYNSSTGRQTHWTVPGTEDWQSDDILLCDGTWAYGVRRGTDLFRIELLTGKEEVLFTADRMMCGGISANGNVGNGKNLLLIDHDWLYFLAKKEDSIGLYRLYLPTKKVDLLHNAIPGDTLPHALFLVSPKNTGRIDIIYMNPKLQDLLLQHFREPGSPYNTTHIVDIIYTYPEKTEQAEIDFSAIWEQSRFETTMVWEPRFEFLSVLIQNDSDVPAMRLCSYDTQTGLITDIPVYAKACESPYTLQTQILEENLLLN